MHTRASLERFGAEALIPAGLGIALVRETGPLTAGLAIASSTSTSMLLESIEKLVQPSCQSASSANAPVSEPVTAAAGPSSP
jgi:hypothetical protein